MMEPAGAGVIGSTAPPMMEPAGVGVIGSTAPPMMGPVGFGPAARAEGADSPGWTASAGKRITTAQSMVRGAAAV